MKIKIPVKKAIRYVEEEKEVDLPEETVYFFVGGDRISFCVTPIYSNWKPNGHASQ